MKRWMIALAFGLVLGASAGGVTGCVQHTITTPAGQRAARADAVATRLGELQRAVIDAQRAGKVTTDDARLIVTWISGDSSKTPPVLGAVDLVQASSLDAKTALLTGWQVVRSRLVLVADLASWVPLIDQLLAGI